MSTRRKRTDKSATPLDLIEAAKSGDRLETLIALRDLLAERLQHTESSRDISSMSRRLMQCVSEIETLQKYKQAEEENPFSLRDFRKQIIQEYGRLNDVHKPNAIGAEHDTY